MGGNDTNFGSSFFYNTRNIVLGSVYLFDEWNNSAEIHTLSNEKFLVRNINFFIIRVKKSKISRPALAFIVQWYTC